jgi:DNA-binding LytR/AlgR family response regulator
MNIDWMRNMPIFQKPGLRDELKILLSISIVVFLFFLFFQPFVFERFDFNNNLIFLIGFGVIIFLIMVFVRIIMPMFMMKRSNEKSTSVSSSGLVNFLILLLTSVAYAFYANYVGHLEISFYNMLKLVCISLAPVVVIWQYDLFSELKRQNEALIIEKMMFQEKAEKFEEEFQNVSVELTSDNLNETLHLLIANLVMLKSADNYVEVVFQEGNEFKKKLLRNTLKNIEYQLKSYSNFIRCHRMCIVNIHYIEKIKRDFNNYHLIIRDSDEQIPVSRQYLLKIKESI